MMEIRRWLTHTIVHQWDETDHSPEGFLCICGEIFVQDGSNNKWDPGIVQISEHLKEMNALPEGIDISVFRSSEEIYAEAQEILATYRGDNSEKPKKPSGDDPRSGHELENQIHNIPRAYYVVISIVASLMVFMTLIYPAFQ